MEYQIEIKDLFKNIFHINFIQETISKPRTKYLEASGYEIPIFEFIDMEHTPKNILKAEPALGGLLKRGEQD